MTWLCTLLGIACTSGTITGPATVWDGDTIYIANQPIRLAGIDAEELDEPHGIAAREHLKTLIGAFLVTCHWDGYSYKRKVGICFNGWQELNAAMVRDGYALDCAHYSRRLANGQSSNEGRYRSLEPAGIRLRLTQKGYC